jgi:hypothetical protein
MVTFTHNTTGDWSRELGIFNSCLMNDEVSSTKGDSGSLVCHTKDGKGYIVGQLHSGDQYSSYRCLPADVCPSCLVSVICGAGQERWYTNALSKRFMVGRQSSILYRLYISFEPINVLLNNIIYCQSESRYEVSDSQQLDCWTVRHSDCQTLGLSDTRTDRHLDTRTIRHSDTRTVRHSDTWTIRQSDGWTVGLPTAR